MFMPVIPALDKLRQEDCKFKATLGYLERSCLKNTMLSLPLLSLALTR
jgi:hypothetical protein